MTAILRKRHNLLIFGTFHVTTLKMKRALKITLKMKDFFLERLLWQRQSIYFRYENLNVDSTMDAFSSKMSMQIFRLRY